MAPDTIKSNVSILHWRFIKFVSALCNTGILLRYDSPWGLVASAAKAAHIALFVSLIWQHAADLPRLPSFSSVLCVSTHGSLIGDNVCVCIVSKTYFYMCWLKSQSPQIYYLLLWLFLLSMCGAFKLLNTTSISYWSGIYFALWVIKNVLITFLLMTCRSSFIFHCGRTCMYVRHLNVCWVTYSVYVPGLQ